MKMTWSWHEVDMFWCEFLWVLMSSSHFLAFVWPRSWWICVNSFRHMEIRGFLGSRTLQCIWDLMRLIDIDYWMILTYCMILYDIVWYCMILYDSYWSSAISAILSGSFDLRWWILQRCNGAQQNFQARTDHFDAIKGRVQYVSRIFNNCLSLLASIRSMFDLFMVILL